MVLVKFILLERFIIFICKISLVDCPNSICSRYFYQFIDVNTFLSITRTFVFFPFFLLGFYLQPGFFKQLRRTGWRILSVCILAILFIVFCFYTPENNSDWLLGAYSYEYMGVEDLYGSLIRLVQYTLMLL